MIETASLVNAYVASLESRCIPFNTLKAYRGDLHRFVTTMPGDLGTITAPQIESYLSTGGVGVATSRRRHACLRSFYHWLMLHEYLDASPIDRLVMGKTPEREPRPLAEDQVALVLAAIPTGKTRDRALFTLLYETGMRVSEALGMQHADLDLTVDDEKVRVLGKGGRERTVLLTAAPLSTRLLRRHLMTNVVRRGVRAERRGHLGVDGVAFLPQICENPAHGGDRTWRAPKSRWDLCRPHRRHN